MLPERLGCGSEKLKGAETLKAKADVVADEWSLFFVSFHEVL